MDCALRVGLALQRLHVSALMDLDPLATSPSPRHRTVVSEFAQQDQHGETWLLLGRRIQALPLKMLTLRQNVVMQERATQILEDVNVFLDTLDEPVRDYPVLVSLTTHAAAEGSVYLSAN